MSRSAQVNRRNALQVGSLGLLGVSLPRFLRLRDVRAAIPAGVPPQQRIRSCIFIFYYGGPSHTDTFDMKPDAPLEIRGEFKSISTSVPGLRICEHLPRTARVMHKVALVRSMHHSMRGHDSASYISLTGREPMVGDNQNFGERPDSFPCYGACLSHAWRDRRVLVPHASLPFVMNNNLQNPGQTAGFLGQHYQPLLIQGDPATLAYNAGLPRLSQDMGRERFFQRAALRQALEDNTGWPAHSPSMNVYYERAFDLLGSDVVRDALDLQQESAAMREFYGHGPAGQKYDDDPHSQGNVDLAIARNLRGFNLLLARRLVEAGVPFVSVYDYKQQGKNWDTHKDNFRLHRDHLLPPADQAYAALIEDLDQRGLLDTTLVVAVGEFGRTPRINHGAGRDHWPDCYTALLAGGPIKGGYIHGASDRLGAYPDADPVTPSDLAATIFTLFGVPLSTTVHDLGVRDYPIATGKPIEALFG
ncbi:MAG: hypothetical protein CMJ81_20910 [Planctomycetaceae bacterium]|nr:hypothetical protein [Planctomycetaceae bacterium]MBP62888.1 hypothetical protein [Planctomycetaceae bacterium]